MREMCTFAACSARALFGYRPKTLSLPYDLLMLCPDGPLCGASMTTWGWSLNAFTLSLYAALGLGAVLGFSPRWRRGWARACEPHRGLRERSCRRECAVE